MSTPVSRARTSARAGCRPEEELRELALAVGLDPAADPLRGDVREPGRCRVHLGQRLGCEVEVELRDEPQGADEAERVVLEARRPDRAQLGRRSRSSTPPNGSTRLPSSSRRAMALIVKSRRAMSSSSSIEASLTIAKSRCPGPVDRSARGGVRSMPAGTSARTARSRGCRRTPTSWPCTSMSSTRPWGSSSARRPAWSTPGTRKSSSRWGMPSSSSRTAPPTT